MWIVLSLQVKGELRVKHLNTDFPPDKLAYASSAYALYHVTVKLSFYYLLYLFMNYIIETVNMFNQLISYSC